MGQEKCIQAATRRNLIKKFFLIDIQGVRIAMVSIGAKDVIKGNIPEVNYLIVHDKGLAADFAEAINALTGQGWSIEHIWAAQSFHFALFKRS